jgi:hypothetical protein
MCGFSDDDDGEKCIGVCLQERPISPTLSLADRPAKLLEPLALQIFLTLLIGSCVVAMYTYHLPLVR